MVKIKLKTRLKRKRKTFKPRDLIEELTKKNVKWVWTCNAHDTCKTCVYFYCTCHGLSNSSDLERQAIPKHDKRFIQMTWSNWKIKSSAKTYLFWLRFKDIGVEFDNLDQVQELSSEQIKELIKPRNKLEES